MRETIFGLVTIFLLTIFYLDLRANRIRIVSYFFMNSSLVLIAVFSIFPSTLNGLAKYLGFVLPSNMIFTLVLFISGATLYAMTKRVHRLEKQISILTSVVSALKNVKT